MISATQLKENEEATVSPLTTIHGRHHGSTVACVEIGFLLYSCSTSGVRGLSKYIY